MLNMIEFGGQPIYVKKLAAKLLDPNNRTAEHLTYTPTSKKGRSPRIITPDGRNVPLLQYLYESVRKKPVPPNRCVKPFCGHRFCVNPYHLTVATYFGKVLMDRKDGDPGVMVHRSLQ